jgi:flagellar hook protein FlgE
MSLQTALSGLNAAQTGLDTVSNDLANASTTAFKSQTALFEDVYPAGQTNSPGFGAETEGMDTDLSQGGETTTGNPLDAMIQGDGYFVVSNNGTQQYTRDGAFQLSPDGVLQTLSGSDVMGFQQTAGGGISGTVGPITVNTGAMPANATANIGLNLDLNSSDPAIATAFNPANSATYSESTSVVTYDSLGNADRVNLYFVSQPLVPPATTNTYSVYAQPETSSGTAVGAPTLLTTLGFNQSGALISGGNANLAVTWPNGAAPSNVAFNFANSTLQAQSFAVAGSTNDGYAPGTYSGTKIDANGQIVSTYSNDQTTVNGTLAVANFINPEGLEADTGNIYSATNTSGTAVINTPGNGQAGTLVGGTLEASNASTSTLLVSLIQFQQAYQADTSVLQTEQQDSQRLVQI